MAEFDGEQTVWSRSFDERVRGEHLEDDSAAWRGVTGLLLTIISMGLCLALFTVWVCS
jgi:hypothetical protein